MSYRELSALAVIDAFYKLHPVKFDEDGKGKTDGIEPYLPDLHKMIEDKLGIKQVDRSDFLLRLSRSQCYEQLDYIYGETGDGYLTPLYYRLKAHIGSFIE